MSDEYVAGFESNRPGGLFHWEPGGLLYARFEKHRKHRPGGLFH